MAGISSGFLRLDALLWRHQWTGVLGRGLPAATCLSFGSWAPVAHQLCRVFCQLPLGLARASSLLPGGPLACAQPTVASWKLLWRLGKGLKRRWWPYLFGPFLHVLSVARASLCPPAWPAPRVAPSSGQRPAAEGRASSPDCRPQATVRASASLSSLFQD